MYWRTKMFEIISRQDAILLAIKGEEVYQIDVEGYPNISKVDELRVDEIVQHPDVFYVIKEKDNE